MLLHLLAVGDVVAQGGLDCLHRHLRRLKKEHDVHFTVVNGENAAGLGLLPQHAEELFDAGADVITLGNHTWNRLQIADFLEDDRIPSAPPTTPAGCPAGAGACTTAPAACASAS